MTNPRRMNQRNGTASERDVVVEVTGGRGAWRLCATAAALAEATATPTPHAAATAGTALTAACAATSAAAEHLHLATDDLGRVAVTAFLVLPLAGAQAALDVHLRALAQVLRGDLAQAAEQGHRVPLGALLVFAGLLVLPVLGRRQAKVRHGHARGHGPRLRVRTQVSDQNHLVDAARHGCRR